jgi:hypothetical protein
VGVTVVVVVTTDFFDRCGIHTSFEPDFLHWRFPEVDRFTKPTLVHLLPALDASATVTSAATTKDRTTKKLLNLIITYPYFIPIQLPSLIRIPLYDNGMPVF